MNSSSSTPFAGVTVRAGVAGEDGREWSAVSDPTGRFRIELDEEAVAHLLGQRRHRELTFRMYSGSGPLFLGSQNIVVSTATLRGSETLTLSTEPVTGTAGFAVSGYVVQADGTPVRTTVTLYRKDLRTETSLGSGTTDATGRFVIRYPVSSGFTDRADFTVRLAAVDITASVGPICNPPPDLVVRLVEGNVPYRGPSEFDLDLAALSPLIGTYSVGSITAEEVEYLQCRSDYEPAAIARLVRAHSLGGGVSERPPTRSRTPATRSTCTSSAASTTGRSPPRSPRPSPTTWCPPPPSPTTPRRWPRSRPPASTGWCP